MLIRLVSSVICSAKKLRLLSAMTGFLFISLNAYSAQLLIFEGAATDPKTSTLLYVERHRVIMNESGDYLSAYVEYRDPEGQVFAEKTLDYAKSTLMPDMMYFDKRSNERISVFFSPKSIDSEAGLRVLIEQEQNRDESFVKLDDSVVVVDAGFDRLIDKHWNTIRKSKEFEFSFLAITRFELFSFEVIESKANETSAYLELHPRNFFINLLVAPILLEYDIKTERLLKFSGLTNIERYKNGKRTEQNFIADIKYSYEPIKPFFMTQTIKSNDVAN